MSNLLNFFSLISDETRFRIMILLKQSELCVCQLCGVLKLSQPRVSKHLARLRDSGFVADERRERFVYYSLKIEDFVIDSLLDDIVRNIGNYPQLLADQTKLIDRDLYIKNCVPVKTINTEGA